MNKDVCNSLSADEREAFDRAADFAYNKLGDVMNAAFSEQIERLRSDGAKVRLLSDSEVSEWESITNYRDIQDKWLNEKIEAGLKNAQEVLEAVLKFIVNK